MHDIQQLQIVAKVEQAASAVDQIQFINSLALEIRTGFRDEELGRLLPMLQRA
ncbi:MAG: hypothetical protein K9N62_15935 [Verrucomicrobia bacterium]|jgi:hypothetical protein|nr:hypothetical protein [Verrucomicrobiota bacterium]